MTSQYTPDEDDLPVDMDSQDSDLPLETGEFVEITSRPEAVDNMLRQHAALLKADTNEEDVFTTYGSLDPTEDPKLMVNRLAIERGDKEQRALKSYFEENLGDTPEAVSLSVDTYASLSEENKGKGTVERHIAESLVGFEDPEEPELDAIEAELMVVNALTEKLDNYTGFEKVLDVAKMMLPTTAVDNYQLTGKVFGAESYLRDVVIGLKDMRRNDPTRFQKVFPEFMKELESTLPKSKQIPLLASIIDPRGEEETQMFGNLDVAFDVIDIGSTAVGVALTAARLTRTANTIKLANRAKNKDLAVDLNSAHLLDETDELTRKTGIEKETAYSNASPFDVSELDDSYTDGLSSMTIERINRVRAHQAEVEKFLRSDSILKENMLSKEERMNVKRDFYREMKTLGAEKLRVVEKGPVTTKFSYELVDPTTGNRVKETVNLDLTIDAKTGTWVRTEASMAADYMTSPTVFAKHAIEDVQAAIRLDSTSAAVAAKFQQLQTEALKPIFSNVGKKLSPFARKELHEIDSVLMAGDSYKDSTGIRGKVYSTRELRAGVVDGIKLNDRQIEAYYNLRGLYDSLFWIRNDEMRDALVSQGLKEVRLGDLGLAVGKVYTQEGAVANVNSQGLVRVFDTSLNEIRTLKGDEIALLYQEGKTLNKLQNAVDVDGQGNLFDLVVTRGDSIADLPTKVLHYKDGYVPKVNKNAHWFVKEMGSRTVNGVTHTGQALKTVRMFASKTEATRWAETQENASKLRVLFDRELEQQVVGSSQVGSGGGLYTGARATEAIPFGTDGLPSERLNTFEALGHNLQSLERYVTRNQWRMGMQQKWVNSAKAAGFNVTKFEKNQIPEGHPAGKGLRRMADQIEVWSGFPTNSELLWDGMVSSTMEWALNSRLIPLKDKTIVRGANFMRDHDPISLVRSVAFHSLLGIFNPAQVWVQAQGAALAFSLNPTGALDIFRMQSALVMTSRMGDNTAAIHKVAKGFGIPEKELESLTIAWNKSGYQQSVTNTADHSAASQGFGITSDAIKRTLDSGLLFYRTGELFNRRYSFAAAALKKGKEKGTFKFTDDELKGVMDEANKTMLNLSKANRAAWQHGVLSIPTQFLQVQAKFMESLFGLNTAFTIRERMKIMTGQLALYGVAGVPLGGLGFRWAQETLGYDQADIEEMDPMVAEAINNGFWGLFANTALGADIDLSNRGAIAAGMTEFTLDLMFSEAGVGEKVMGAFGTVPHRFFKAFKTIKPMVANDSDQPITSEEIMMGLNSLASITSTWNNMDKGRFMLDMQMLVDSRGNAIIKDGNFDNETIWFTMLGFQPSELRRIRDRDGLVRSRKERRAQVTSDLVGHYWNYVRAYKGADNDAERDVIADRYEAGTRVLMASLRSDGERQKVRESLNAKLTNPEDKRTKSIREFIEEFSEGQILELGSMVAAAKASGVIQNTSE